MGSAMSMRVDCKHYESRTYPSGEVARMCRLDLAPEAPWRCPDDCPKYEHRGYDAGWTLGSLRTANEPVAEPDNELPEDAAALLDAAEDVINEVGAGIVDEIQEQRDRDDNPRWWQRFRRRK
jgi:hypothetical protein